MKSKDIHRGDLLEHKGGDGRFLYVVLDDRRWKDAASRYASRRKPVVHYGNAIAKGAGIPVLMMDATRIDGQPMSEERLRSVAARICRMFALTGDDAADAERIAEVYNTRSGRGHLARGLTIVRPADLVTREQGARDRAERAEHYRRVRERAAERDSQLSRLRAAVNDAGIDAKVRELGAGDTRFSLVLTGEEIERVVSLIKTATA